MRLRKRRNGYARSQSCSGIGDILRRNTRSKFLVRDAPHEADHDYDGKSGQLVKNQVWLLDVSSFPTDIGEQYVYAHGSYDQRAAVKSRHDCPLDKRHVTESLTERLPLELFGRNIADFVIDVDEPEIIISDSFASRLEKTDFTGFRIRDGVIVSHFEPTIPPPPKPKLWFLDMLGGAGHNLKRMIFHGAPNLCPLCGKVPMICPGCGATNWPKCDDCDQWNLYLPEMPECSNPKGFLIRGYPPDIPIVDGSTWDGSDFFRADGLPFVSKRVQEWFDRNHVTPDVLKPALLDVEGMNDKSRLK